MLLAPLPPPPLIPAVEMLPRPKRQHARMRGQDKMLDAPDIFVHVHKMKYRRDYV